MPIPDLLCTPYTCPPLTPGWPTTYTSYREIAYRDFAMYDVQGFCQYQNPNLETPMPPDLCAGCATCHLADVVC